MKRANLLAIGGGKGGTGKTFLAVNLGTALAERGKEVILVDADWGGANLHTMMGIRSPSRGLDDFFGGRKSIGEVILPTSVPHLYIICGTVRGLPTGNLRYPEKQRLIRHLHSLRAEYIILDLGGGVSPHVTDLFLISDRRLLLVTPEPTSLENAYRFIRGSFFRLLQGLIKTPDIRRKIEGMIEGGDNRFKTPSELIRHIEELSPDLRGRLSETITSFSPMLVINQVKEKGERDIGISIRNVCRRYFGFELQYLGYVAYDPKIPYSILRGRPFLWEYPHTEAAHCLRNISYKLMGEGGQS